jgi:uncharacterized radical SAM protein YgiQ
MFLPTTKKEMELLGWDVLDVILVTGDSYIDSPFMGVSVIGKLLSHNNFRVGIIAQPDPDSAIDIKRLGEPELFWGVTGGAVDSMVANYTALKKRRKKDDFTPGGENRRRPDRAAIVYTNLIRKFYKNTKPVVLGGIEASLRRISHYDFWSNRVRRSILFDAKADLLVYGMAENTTLALARALEQKEAIENIPGLCYISPNKKETYIELPSHSDVIRDKQAFIRMFTTLYNNNDPVTARGLCQKQDTRYLIHNPPAPYLSQRALDEVHGLNFERDLHPFYKKDGSVRALDTIQFSITTHRGCYGECNFCAISVHQGKTVRWRSEASLLQEAKLLASHPDFKGYILDAGGPTANMYGFECRKKLTKGSCTDKRCLFPAICPTLKVDHGRQIHLLEKMRNISGIKKVFIASGLRYDLLLHDKKAGQKYLDTLVRHHVSGQMKIAPEHSEERVLSKMGKPDTPGLLEFRDKFLASTRRAGKKQFLTYYFIAAHPGCTDEDMRNLKLFTSRKLHSNPEQVQIFTPTPSTYSSLMYYTGIDPFSGKKVFVEKEHGRREKQKTILVPKKPKFK